MKGVVLPLLLLTFLTLFVVPASASEKTPPDGPGGPEASSMALPEARPDLTPAFAPPPLTLSRGIIVSSLDEPSKGGPDIVSERVRIPCGKDRVAVDIFRPSQPGRYPVVVLLHGSHGPARCEKYYLQHAEALARSGFVSLFVRYYDRGRKGRGNRALWTKTIEDTLSYASALPWADPDRMALLGFSQGAFLALNDAPLDPRIRAVVAFYGGLSPGYVPQAKENMPPTLLFHGTADGIVPVKRSLQTLTWLREEGRPADLVVYPGAGHGFLLNSNGGADAKAAEDSWFRTLAFLNFHLRYPAWAPAVEAARPFAPEAVAAPAEMATAEEPAEDAAEPPPTAPGDAPPLPVPPPAQEMAALQPSADRGPLPQLVPNTSVDLFTQPPLQTIPYLDPAASAYGKDFALVNPPSDQVLAIARSAPLKRWSHHHSKGTGKKSNAAVKPRAAAAKGKSPAKSSAKPQVKSPAKPPAKAPGNAPAKSPAKAAAKAPGNPPEKSSSTKASSAKPQDKKK
jgi:carboxymethylenebutenolidase